MKAPIWWQTRKFYPLINRLFLHQNFFCNSSSSSGTDLAAYFKQIICQPFFFHSFTHILSKRQDRRWRSNSMQYYQYHHNHLPPPLPSHSVTKKNNCYMQNREKQGGFSTEVQSPTYSHSFISRHYLLFVRMQS